MCESRLFVERLLIGHDILRADVESTLFKGRSIHLNRAARNGQSQPLGARHCKEATSKICECAVLRKPIHQRWMRHRRQEASTWHEDALAITRGVAHNAQRQLIEKHRRKHEIKLALGERQSILNIEGKIFRILDAERRLRDMHKSLRLIGDDKSVGRLARETSEHHRREIAITRAQLQY